MTRPPSARQGVATGSSWQEMRPSPRPARRGGEVAAVALLALAIAAATPAPAAASCFGQLWSKPSAASAQEAGGRSRTQLSVGLSQANSVPGYNCLLDYAFSFASICESPDSGYYVSRTFEPPHQPEFSVAIPVGASAGANGSGLAYPAAGRPLLCYVVGREELNDQFEGDFSVSAALYLSPPGFRVAEPEYCAGVTPGVSGYSPAPPTRVGCPRGGSIRVEGATVFRGFIDCWVPPPWLSSGSCRAEPVVLNAYTYEPKPICAAPFTQEVAALCNGRESCVINATAMDTPPELDQCRSGRRRGGSGEQTSSMPGGGAVVKQSQGSKYVVVSYSCSGEEPPCRNTLPRGLYLKACGGCSYNCQSQTLTCSACKCACQPLNAGAGGGAEPGAGGGADSSTLGCSCPVSLDYGSCRPGAKVFYDPLRASLMCA